jgi:hypothetical protein
MEKNEIPRPGIYRHFKNKKLYRVLGVARHSETDEELVVYEPLYESDSKYWVRPVDMFMETVEHEGVMQPRFQWIGDEAKPELLNE